MSINPFIDARERFLSAVSTLPPGYLDGNAAPPVAIIEELKRSHQLELSIIQAIKGLDVSDQKAVAQVITYIKNYDQARDFERERTHCRNIDRIARALLLPLQGGTDADRARVKDLKDLLRSLGSHDMAFLDEIEQVMKRARVAVNRIDADVQASLTDPTKLAAARQDQQAFVDEFDPEFDQLKNVLKRMNELANDLIDRL